MHWGARILIPLNRLSSRSRWQGAISSEIWFYQRALEWWTVWPKRRQNRFRKANMGSRIRRWSAWCNSWSLWYDERHHGRQIPACIHRWSPHQTFHCQISKCPPTHCPQFLHCNWCGSAPFQAYCRSFAHRLWPVHGTRFHLFRIPLNDQTKTINHIILWFNIMSSPI